MNSLALTANELLEALLKAMPAKLPILIKGAPGVGKTDIVRTVKETLGWNWILSHPVVSDPTEAKGLGAIIDGEDGQKIACFLPYGDLREAMTCTTPTIWFLDDLGQASPATQAAFMQLILSRSINGQKISDNIVFVAATNRRQDKAGVTSILEPVKSRFASIIELTADVDSWVDWALDNDLVSDIIYWIKFRPQFLFTEEATNDIVNHPCPRTIANASKLIKAGLGNLKLLAGAIGETAAVDFLGFQRVIKNLPNMQQIVLEPMKAKVPEELASLYATVSALVDQVTVETFEAIAKYGSRLPKEFYSLLMRGVVKRDPDFAETTTYINWTVEHGDKFMK